MMGKGKIKARVRIGSGQQTPRAVRSSSTTNMHYLQLQMDTSGKKKIGLQRTLGAKQQRIRELQGQISQSHALVSQTLDRWRQAEKGRNEQRIKNQRLGRQLRQAVELCKRMQEKCRQLCIQKEQVEMTAQGLKGELQDEKRKLKDVRETRRRQKAELRELVLPLLDLLANQHPNNHIAQLSQLL